MATVRRAGKLEIFERHISKGQAMGLRLGAMILVNEARMLAPRKTGRLKRNLSEGKVIRTGRFSQAIHVGSNLEYAAAQEFGATIRPRKAKMLAIPIGDLVGSPRKYNLTLIRTKSKKLILVDSSGVAQYALVRQVIVPPHPYLRPAARNKARIISRAVLSGIMAELRSLK